MPGDDLTLPAALREAHAAGFDYRHGDGVDFEPYDEFLTASETTEWWRAWTGNVELDGTEWRIFGQDGTGGLAAFWLIRPGQAVESQPVVFLGSEGETGVVACDLGAYLWLLAAGFGPLEASMYPRHEHQPRPDLRLTQLAQRCAPSAQQPADQVIRTARAEFPDFDQMIASRCR